MRTIKTDEGGTTYYFFPEYEERVSGGQTVRRKYYYAGGTRVAMSEGTDLRAIVTDHLGSASVLVNASGTVVREQGYEPFGESLYTTGNADPVYTFTGKEQDKSGAYYFGARYHDPELGRFLTPDPLMLELDYRKDEVETSSGKVDLLGYFGGGLDWYEYCGQNPVKYIDPDGNQMAIPIPLPWFDVLPIPTLPVLPNPANPSVPESEENPLDKPGIDLGDTDTWPAPPGDGPFTEGEPSRQGPRERGEKSLYDKDGGEWRPHLPDKYHPRGHWDYKPPATPKNRFPEWQDVYPDITPSPNPKPLPGMEDAYA